MRNLLFAWACLMYFANFYLIGEDLDPWNALHYYYEWVDSIAFLTWDSKILSNLYITNLSHLSAPSPGASWLVFLITRFVSNPLIVFHVINMSIFFAVTRLPKKMDLKRFLLLVYLFTFSFYWYILIFLTHRFKIAIVFLLFYLIIRNNTRKYFLTLSFLSHLSILALTPLLLGLKGDWIERIERRNIVYFVLFYVTLLFFILRGIDSELFSLVWRAKLSYIAKYYLLVLPLLLIFFFSYNYLIKIASNNFLMIYVLTTLVLFDRSRLLMVYFVFMSLLHLAKTKSYGRLDQLFGLMCIWDLYRSSEMGLIKHWAGLL